MQATSEPCWEIDDEGQYRPTGKKDIVLRMSEKEAEILLAVTRHIGGSPSGPRGVFDEMARELRGREIRSMEFSMVQQRNTIHFEGDAREPVGNYTPF